MFASARKAFASLCDRALIGVLVKSLALTLLLFVLAFEGLLYGVENLTAFPWHWVNAALLWLAPLFFFLLFIYLGAPVVALVATFFLDEVADAIEAKDYPNDPKARAVGFFASAWAGLRISLVLLFVNIALLPFHILLPGISGLLTILVDGWFLGRQYFELAATRHLSGADADRRRRRYSSAVLLGGLMIAVMAAIPFINLITPLFGAALMVHAFKRLSGERLTGSAGIPSGVLNL